MPAGLVSGAGATIVASEHDDDDLLQINVHTAPGPVPLLPRRHRALHVTAWTQFLAEETDKLGSFSSNAQPRKGRQLEGHSVSADLAHFLGRYILLPGGAGQNKRIATEFLGGSHDQDGPDAVLAKIKREVEDLQAQDLGKKTPIKDVNGHTEKPADDDKDANAEAHTDNNGKDDVNRSDSKNHDDAVDGVAKVSNATKEEATVSDNLKSSSKKESVEHQGTDDGKDSVKSLDEKEQSVGSDAKSLMDKVPVKASEHSSTEDLDKAPQNKDGDSPAHDDNGKAESVGTPKSKESLAAGDVKSPSQKDSDREAASLKELNEQRQQNAQSVTDTLRELEDKGRPFFDDAISASHTHDAKEGGTDDAKDGSSAAHTDAAKEGGTDDAKEGGPTSHTDGVKEGSADDAKEGSSTSHTDDSKEGSTDGSTDDAKEDDSTAHADGSKEGSADDAKEVVSTSHGDDVKEAGTDQEVKGGEDETSGPDSDETSEDKDGDKETEGQDEAKDLAGDGKVEVNGAELDVKPDAV